MFVQSDFIRDYIFPIVTVSSVKDEMSIKNFLGTGFLVGNRGFGMTAAHVAQNFMGEDVVAMFVADSRWKVIPITQHEIHAQEDAG